ncbi:MAG: choice-of-anchor tandem repeat GloVer-containing protein [Panacagrimonas sp.]
MPFPNPFRINPSASSPPTPQSPRVRHWLAGLVLGLAAIGSAHAIPDTLTTLHAFTGTAPEQGFPDASPAGAPAGNVYGVAKDSSRQGNIWRIAPDGAYSVIRSFDTALPEGSFQPRGQLTAGADGRLYGAASGTGDSFIRSLVYSMDTSGGDLRVLHLFQAATVAGQIPVNNAPVFGSDGRLYGIAGGALSGGGFIYRMNTDGSDYVELTRLSGFNYSTLTAGPDNAFYGFVVLGGLDGSGPGYVYRLQDFSLTVLYTFQSPNPQFTDRPLQPDGNLAFGPDGFLYGTTRPTSPSDDVVVPIRLYRISPSGVFSLVGVVRDPALDNPDDILDFDTGGVAGLTLGQDGKLYGVLRRPPAFPNETPTNQGRMFRLTPVANSNPTVEFLTPFTGVNGANPRAALSLAADGQLYGTTISGGFANAGTVYRFNTVGMAGVSIAVTPGNVFTDDPATLQWSSTNATGCTASGAWSGPRATSGSLAISQTTAGSYAYTLECSNSGGSAMSTAMLEVAAFPAPSLVFGLTPATIRTDGQATLTWTTENASACAASGAWTGGKGTSGNEMANKPTPGSYTYTLSCTGRGGSTSSSQVLTVIPIPPPAVTLNLNAVDIRLGQSALLSWTGADAASCRASGAWSGNKPVTGNQSVKPLLIGNYTYTLTCFGPGGTTSRSATLRVTLTEKPTLSLSVSPSQIRLGQSAALNWDSVHAGACTASGAWSGNKPVDGSEGRSPTAKGAYAYTLSCTGPGGSVQKTVQLRVN